MRHPYTVVDCHPWAICILSASMDTEPPMNAILQFVLPEEQQEFQLAIRAADWHSVALEIDQKLRCYLKYGHTFKSANEVLEVIRKFLHDEMNDRHLQFH